MLFAVHIWYRMSRPSCNCGYETKIWSMMHKECVCTPDIRTQISTALKKMQGCFCSVHAMSWGDKVDMTLDAPTTSCWMQHNNTGWGGHLFWRFCNMFSKSSPFLLGQHGSRSTVLWPGELSEICLQNPPNKWPPHPVHLFVGVQIVVPREKHRISSLFLSILSSRFFSQFAKLVLSAWT